MWDKRLIIKFKGEDLFEGYPNVIASNGYG